MNETVAVTGGTGFVGRCLIDLLLDHDKSVRVLTRQPDSVQDHWGNHVEVWHGDLTIPETLSGFTENVSTVYNLAGTVSDTESYARVNAAGTENLLKECAQYPIKRFVHLSSAGVVGPSQQEIIDERTPCNPSNEYESSKLNGELVAIDYWREFGVPVTVLRPTIVFGEGRRQQQDSFAAWMRSINSGRFRFIGNGQYVANYVYVRDVATACIHVTRYKQAIGEIYFVSDSCLLREFVETAASLMKTPLPSSIPLWMARTAVLASSALEKLTKRSLPLTDSRVKALTSVALYDSSKLRRDLNYLPVIGYREGLNRTLRWYRAEGLLAF